MNRCTFGLSTGCHLYHSIVLMLSFLTISLFDPGYKGVAHWAQHYYLGYENICRRCLKGMAGVTELVLEILYKSVANRRICRRRTNYGGKEL